MGKRSNSFVVDDESGDERPATVTKKIKQSSSKDGAEVDSEGNTFWEVCRRLRASAPPKEVLGGTHSRFEALLG